MLIDAGQGLFAILLGALLAYMSFGRRQVDLFTIGTVGAGLYFMPALVGQVRIWSPNGRVTEGIPPDAFTIMSVVVAALLITSLAFDRIRPKHGDEVSVRHASKPVAVALLGLAYVSFAVFVLDFGPSILDATKLDIYRDRNTTLYNMAVYPAMCLLVYGTSVRSRFLVTGAAVLLLLDSFLVMNRTFLVIGTASASLVYLSRRGPLRLVGLWRWVAAGILFTWTMMAYHHVKQPIKDLDFGQAFDRVTQPGYIGYAVLTSEPFTAQGVLSEVVRADFRIPLDAYASTWMVGIPLWSETWGRPPRFSAQFQPVLFPGVGQIGAMAENYWAQGWAAGRWVGVGVHLMAYLIGIIVLSRGISVRNPLLSSASAVVGVWVAFYIHRNDVFGMMIAIRRIAGLFLLMWIAALLLRAVVPRRAKLAATTT